jgi:hypothetical protein
MVSAWLSPSVWHNLMQYRCSSRSVIFAENNNATRTAYTLSLTRWLHATDAVCWREKSTYAHEGILHFPATAHLPCFISFRGKKSRRILFEQPTYVCRMHTFGSCPAYQWLSAEGRDVAVLYHLLQQSTGIYDSISTAASILQIKVVLQAVALLTVSSGLSRNLFLKFVTPIRSAAMTSRSAKCHYSFSPVYLVTSHCCSCFP